LVHARVPLAAAGITVERVTIVATTIAVRRDFIGRTPVSSVSSGSYSYSRRRPVDPPRRFNHQYKEVTKIVSARYDTAQNASREC
jgi:hypothetical protein